MHKSVYLFWGVTLICWLLVPTTFGVSLIVWFIGLYLMNIQDNVVEEEIEKNRQRNLKQQVDWGNKEKLLQHVAERRAKESNNTKDINNLNKLQPDKTKKTYINSTQHTLSNKLSIIRKLEENGFVSLWYIVHINNLSSIIQHGILNHNDAHAQNLVSNDISDPGAQKWREKQEPIHERQVHEYVPLYINYRNPMLYVLKNLNENLCLIEIDTSIIEDRVCLISDGNAASRETKFYDKTSEDNFLSWDVLRSDYWANSADGKRKKCAEVLVYPSVPYAYFKKIHFCSVESMKKIYISNLEKVYSPHLFFS